MKFKRFFFGSGLRYVLIGLAAALLVMGVSAGILAALYNGSWHNKIASLSDAYFRICDELEFNGMSSGLEGKIRDYNLLYKEKANVIITDMDGKILYSLNSAYIPESGRFYAVNKKNSNIAYIVDSLGNTKYIASLDYTYANFGSSGNQSVNQKIQLMNSGFQNLVNSMDEEGRINKDDQTSIALVSSNISSKGYLLYSVSAVSPYDLVLNDRSVKAYNDALYMIGPAPFGIVLLIFWLLLPAWVFTDAAKRGFKAPLWTILTLIANIVGLLVYLVVRPEFERCKNCGRQQHAGFIHCPFCGARNKEVCPACSKVLEPEWSVCPDCGRQVDVKTSTDLEKIS